MHFTKNNTVGLFPGISVQLFDFGTPVSQIASIACHALPGAWGAYHLPNASNTRTMLLRLEVSPFYQPTYVHPDDIMDAVDDIEEYRPLNGDVWIYAGSSTSMWDNLNNNEANVIQSLAYYKLDQSKRFSDNMLALRAQGVF